MWLSRYFVFLTCLSLAADAAAQQDEASSHRSMKFFGLEEDTKATAIKVVSPTKKCRSSDDCGTGLYCSKGKCRKNKTCGNRLDCLNPNNRFITPRCLGRIRCNNGVCSKKCGNPCTKKKPQTSCFAPPCDVTKCNEPWENCVNDFCGGCNAIFIDSAGRRVCKNNNGPSATPHPTKSPTTPKPTNLPTRHPIKPKPTPKPSRVCRPSQCGPKNERAMLCPDGSAVGLRDCLFDDEAGRCQWEYAPCPTACEPRDCGPQHKRAKICPGGSIVGLRDCLFDKEADRCKWEYAPCPEKCDAKACGPKPLVRPIQCPDGSLTGIGDCKFDKESNQCQWESITCPTCESNDDCPESEFCSRGLCRTDSTCEDLVDCLNPANLYRVILCVGFLTCTKDSENVGRCGVTCADGFCPPELGAGEDCPSPSSCAVAKCGEGSVTCTDYNCGGCNAIFYNAQGEQVCKPEPKLCQPADCGPMPQFSAFECPDGSFPFVGDCKFDEDQGACSWEIVGCPRCESDDDCSERQFCSNGFCRKNGSCTSLVDCLNPANKFRTKRCRGYLTCDTDRSGGTCDLECGPSCPPGVKQATCPSPGTCEKVSCENENVSCRNYNCGGCNAIFFNAKGDQVCGSLPSLPPPPKQCKLEDCGALPPVAARPCPDGSFAGAPSCEFNEKAGECRFEFSVCPGCESSDDCGKGQFCSLGQCRLAPKCGLGDCGVLPPVAARPCPDGSFAGAPSCEFDEDAGECQFEFSECPGCESSDDCGEDQFCSRGACRKKGTCSDLVDCQNPNNRFPRKKCIGYLLCDKGTCDIECGSRCPPQPQVIALPAKPGPHIEKLSIADPKSCQSPCSRASCIGPSTCVDDFCKCDAVFIDPAGNRLC